MTALEELAAVARAVTLAGGTELRRRYRAGDADGEYTTHDVKANADEAAEARMLPIVRRAFPEHAVFAEESGEFIGSEPHRWILDPLDGTNNFAAGLPTFACSAAVLAQGEPEVAALTLPATGETYLVRRGEGVRYEGERTSAESDVPLEAATVATIVGREVPHDPDLSRQFEAVRGAIDGTVKRTVESWAPTVHSGLLARGRIQGVVQFHPDEEERAVTELLATEAGAAVRREGELSVAATDEGTAERLWRAIDDDS